MPGLFSHFWEDCHKERKEHFCEKPSPTGQGRAFYQDLKKNFGANRTKRWNRETNELYYLLLS